MVFSHGRKNGHTNPSSKITNPAKMLTSYSHFYLVAKLVTLQEEYGLLMKETYPNQLDIDAKKEGIDTTAALIKVPHFVPKEQKEIILQGSGGLFLINGVKVKMFFEGAMTVKKYDLPSECSLITKESPLGRVLWNQKVGFKGKLEGEVTVEFEVLELYTYKEILKDFFPTNKTESIKIEVAS